MARADRLERLDAQRLALEADYLACLTTALRATAAGRWGMFDHNARAGRSGDLPAEVTELLELGQAINDMRERLMLEDFALHDQFLAAHGPVKSDAVGEPKQAQAWLD